MTAATDLWTAVVAAYDDAGLISLTNIRDGAQGAVNTTVGQTAAQSVIDLWPAYAQVAYDATDALHVEVGIRGVIATLWERGGSATTIAEVKWDEVFGDDGLLAKVRRTGPRGRQGPRSNSGVTQRAENIGGRKVRGWSEPASLPRRFLPRRVIAND